MRVVPTNRTAQSITNLCIMTLQRCGVSVTTEPGSAAGPSTVTCWFPPNLNDPHAAPDGEERTYDEAYFTLLVYATFLDLVEREIIDAETGVAV